MFVLIIHHMDAIERARVALEGLSVGDAFGEQFLHSNPATRSMRSGARQAPTERRWMWTDDTAMAMSIVDVLAAHHGIDATMLGQAFARRYLAQPARGYGGGAHQVLAQLAEGVPYATAAAALFAGQGSCGNGGGMRAAPVGAYFAGDLVSTVEHATRSAAPTHAHRDGIAGAVAIAVAASLVFSGERSPGAILDAVVARTPAGPTHDTLRRALKLLAVEPITAASELGNGSRVLSADTVPFAVWCAATHLDDYAGALWACTEVGGDIDTTCAMVGGIIVGATGLAGIPPEWRASREDLVT